MKNYFFSLFIATCLVACGSSQDDLGDGDAGAGEDSLSAKADSLPTKTDTLRPGTCVVPEPKVKSMFGATVTSTPRGGYRTLSGSPACTSSYNPQPMDCSRPEDGFSDGKTSWCCISTAKGSDGLYHPTRAHVQCFSDTMILVPSRAPGNTALCSTNGDFVGWDCMDDLIGQ